MYAFCITMPLLIETADTMVTMPDPILERNTQYNNKRAYIKLKSSPLDFGYNISDINAHFPK